MALQDITLKDKTAKIKVAVWDNMVGTITTGQLLSLTRCRVRLFNDEKKKLSTTLSSIAEVCIIK